MREINEKTWNKLMNETILEELKENNLFVYTQEDEDFVLKWKGVNKGKIKEELEKIKCGENQPSFLRNIFVKEDSDFIPIQERITEKLEQRLYFAVKHINNDFADIPKKEVTDYLVKLADDMSNLIDRKLEEKSKKDVVDLI